MRDTNVGKLAQTWEGPYRITAIASTRAYYLEDMDETPLPRPWNVHNLKKFYQWSSIHGKMYLVLTNMITMKLIRAGSVNFIYLDNRSLNTEEIEKIQAVCYILRTETCFSVLSLSPSRCKPYSKNILSTETCFSVWSLSPSRWKPYSKNILINWNLLLSLVPITEQVETLF